MAVASDPVGDLRSELRRFEAGLVYRTLAAVSGDRRQAAQRLGIGLSSLYRKLEEFEREGLGREGESRMTDR
jgi:DNA-binding NtrC family response regulator